MVYYYTIKQAVPQKRGRGCFYSGLQKDKKNKIFLFYFFPLLIRFYCVKFNFSKTIL